MNEKTMYKVYFCVMLISSGIAAIYFNLLEMYLINICIAAVIVSGVKMELGN